jgi:ABC-type Mn2+/Zn2+ transport system permease subunit
VLSAVALFVMGRALTFTGYDPEGARVQGLPVTAIETGFWLVFALQVSVSTRALGSLPVFALAVLPAAAGLAVAGRLGTAIFIGAFGGALSGAGGYVVAFLAELPVGASQAACAALFACLCYAMVQLLHSARRAAARS